MKFHCNVDGVHFVGDFEDTLKPPCNFWGDLGFSNLPIELKKKFWHWLFVMPSDEIGLVAKIGIGVQFITGPIIEEDRFENLISGYRDLSEKEQQQLQKEIFKRKNRGEDIQVWIKKFNAEKAINDKKLPN